MVHPQFKKLATIRCLARLVSLLPAPLGRQIRATYIKNDTLFFIVAHPGAKMEIDNIATSIKSPLTKALAMCDETLTFTQIRSFVTNQPLEKPLPTRPTEYRMYERATGEFENPYTNPKLHATLEAIRALIQQAKA